MRGLPAVLETPALVAATAAMSAAAAFALVEVSPPAAIALALLPVIALAVVYVLTSGQVVLYAAAIVLPITSVGLFTRPVVGPLFPQDIIAALALGAWIFAKYLAPGRVPPIPRTPVLGWPFVLFAAAILSATLRGHYAYGASLIGQPLRLFLYAAIVAALAGMTAQKMYRLLLVLFYPGAVVAALVAVFYLVTGGSATAADDLSTGGTRLLGISTSLYCAGALFLALLSLRLTQDLRARVLHLCVAAVATFGVIAAFGRAAYAAVALVGVVFMLTSGQLRKNLLSVVPLALPFLIVLAIGISQTAPDFVSAVTDRVFSPPARDANVQWRVEANHAVLAQVREQPLFGVGFGRDSEFFLSVEDPATGLPALQRVEIGQDPHNGYIFLWAGGGLVLLGSFALLLGTFALDAVRRYRSTADPTARLIILWACATLFPFLFNAASGASFESPENILTIWALLVLPSVVPLTAEDSPEGEHVAADTPSRPSRGAATHVGASDSNRAQR